MLFYTPRWIFAIFAGTKEADLVSVGIWKIGLAPKPGLIGWLLGKFEAEGFETFDFGVEVVALEVKNDIIGRNSVVTNVN